MKSLEELLAIRDKAKAATLQVRVQATESVS